ncbi:MAG: type I-E CRISPR-associated protein Cas5/CasD [Rhizobiaceae bacterium]|nr:type I-E CRISPR-associated protein Cas5/CasD [Rhizobiaceae bacterium]
MTHRWLHLRLCAPLLSFGGVAIDHMGPTRDFPSASALTGLFANALGLRREAAEAHQNLQNRLIYGALTAHQGALLNDMQNAKLEKNDKGWTTRGYPLTRDGGTYDAMHRRSRDYLADHDCRVVLRLDDGIGPDLETLAAALDRPARPLFIGRKPCLPAARLFAGWVEGAGVREALAALNIPGRAIWPASEGRGSGTATDFDMPDLRDWRTGLHAGSRRITGGTIE